MKIAPYFIPLLLNYIQAENTKLCGGVSYSATGGFLDPGPWNQDYGCQWILKTDLNKGITINITRFDITNSFDCYDEFLEVRSTTLHGPFLDHSWPEYRCYTPADPGTLASYSKDSGILTTRHNALFINYGRNPPGQWFTPGSFEATWTTSEINCCPKIFFNTSGFGDNSDEDVGGLYSRVSGKSYNGYPVYKWDEKTTWQDKEKYMVNCPMFNMWKIVDANYTSFQVCPTDFPGGDVIIENMDGGAYCPQDIMGPWIFKSFNGYIYDDYDVKISCFDCDLNPQEETCACSDDPPAVPEGAEFYNSTNVVGTEVTYTCPSGEEKKAICDPATQTWLPAIITCEPATKPPKVTKPPKGKKPQKGKKPSKGKKRPKGKKPQKGKKPPKGKGNGKKPSKG